MAHLKIKNVGPIKDVDIELNKVNIIMGPQSSGKSTINKIACYCSWVEKKVCLDQSFDFFLIEDGLYKNDIFINELVRFHKLKGYIQTETVIEYESNVVKFTYSHKEGKPVFEWKNQYDYKRAKISYVSAERNMVAAIPNWFDVKFVDNSILSFMSDWGTARQLYTKESPLNTVVGNVKYYFDKATNRDYVIVNSETTLEFTDTSSGLQSIIPLNVLLDNMIFSFDEIDSTKSYKRIQQDESLRSNIYERKFHFHSTRRKEPGSTLPHKYTKHEGDRILIFRDSESCKKYEEVVESYIKTKSCRFYVEEPEQNLFPSAQRDLLYYMLKAIIFEQEHKLFITTHSPYILYALNNCMMGYLVKDNMPQEEAEELLSYKSWINPKDVSVWEIDEGKLRNIQDKDNIVSENYFDQKMKELTDEYYEMLNYYEDAE